MLHLPKTEVVMSYCNKHILTSIHIKYLIFQPLVFSLSLMTITVPIEANLTFTRRFDQIRCEQILIIP